ncbi:MAG TPA: membrane integrity-associated transporter subunit PqiC [Deltaproteobacteria bacterium]|nr:membrane integrity-associated transporter subunit PqiC [Deltaproteobacteria bacterium]
MITKEKFRNIFSLCVLLSFFSVMLVGCTGSSGPSTFYMLHSMEESSSKSVSSATGTKSVSVLLGPISLPGYLDRIQMVTVAGKNQMALDEFNRWVESLRDGFYRVLLEDLSLLLKTPKVYGYDREGSNAVDYQVVIDVTRFDCVPGGEAVLAAFWTVRGMGDSASNIRHKSVFRAPVSGAGFSEVVDAQNQTLTAFSREIASAIQSLQR